VDGDTQLVKENYIGMESAVEKSSEQPEQRKEQQTVAEPQGHHARAISGGVRQNLLTEKR
jgi:hypothetical protein